MKSLTTLPVSYAGECEVTINDRDLDVVARNVIMLLTAFHFSPNEAVPMMLHLWYSAFIPKQMLQSLQDNILPLIQDVCQGIRERRADNLQSKTWNFGQSSLRLVLKKSAWDSLPSYFQAPDGLSKAEAQEIMVATTLAPSRIDNLHRSLYELPPHWRLCTTKFRNDGVLLPFGHSREEFDTPNP